MHARLSHVKRETILLAAFIKAGVIRVVGEKREREGERAGMAQHVVGPEQRCYKVKNGSKVATNRGHATVAVMTSPNQGWPLLKHLAGGWRRDDQYHK